MLATFRRNAFCWFCAKLPVPGTNTALQDVSLSLSAGAWWLQSHRMPCAGPQNSSLVWVWVLHLGLRITSSAASCSKEFKKRAPGQAAELCCPCSLAWEIRERRSQPLKRWDTEGLGQVGSQRKWWGSMGVICVCMYISIHINTCICFAYISEEALHRTG